jgi:hypothetical protein
MLWDDWFMLTPSLNHSIVPEVAAVVKVADPPVQI